VFRLCLRWMIVLIWANRNGEDGTVCISLHDPMVNKFLIFVRIKCFGWVSYAILSFLHSLKLFQM